MVKTIPLSERLTSSHLPALYRSAHSKVELPEEHIDEFVARDLSIDRFERFKGFMWMVGRPYLPRPINQQLVLSRTIVPTTECSLHLVWKAKKIYIKAMPLYLLEEEFYTKRLARDCPSLKAPALGFLYNYLALVPTELDFILAKKVHLFPREYKWEAWQEVARRLLADYSGHEIDKHIPDRYLYGELRLDRLDKIARIWHREWLHGYSALTSLTQYGDFFAEHLGTVATATAHIVVILAAMQVGLASTGLGDNPSFQRASYGFTIVAILSTAVAVSVVLLTFVTVFLWNLTDTLLLRRKRFGGLYITKSAHHTA